MALTDLEIIRVLGSKAAENARNQAHTFITRNLDDARLEKIIHALQSARERIGREDVTPENLAHMKTAIFQVLDLFAGGGEEQTGSDRTHHGTGEPPSFLGFGGSHGSKQPKKDGGIEPLATSIFGNGKGLKRSREDDDGSVFKRPKNDGGIEPLAPSLFNNGTTATAFRSCHPSGDITTAVH